MRTFIRVFTFAILALVAPGIVAGAQTNNAISPTVSISPPVFPIGQTSSVFITLTNGNPASTANIAPGDTFTFTFGPSSGTGVAIESPIMVNSSSLNSSDFAVTMTASNQVVIIFQGLPRQFKAGEIFGVKLSLTAPANVGGSYRLPGSSGQGRRTLQRCHSCNRDSVVRGFRDGAEGR